MTCICHIRQVYGTYGRYMKHIAGIWTIFEISICNRNLSSEMDSDISASQNHHDSTFGRFLKFRSAIEIWVQKWILTLAQIKIITIRYSADFWNFDLWSRFDFRNSELGISQNYHDSIFGWFLKFWTAIEIWVQKWILISAQIKIIMIRYSADFWNFDLWSRLYAQK